MTDRFKLYGEERFEVTEDHLKLVRQMNFRYEDWSEFGAPAVDSKRPYGNSDVLSDIVEIITGHNPYNEDGDLEQWVKDREQQFMKLHKETATVLEIAARTGKFEAGVYRTPTYFREWEKVDA